MAYDVIKIANLQSLQSDRIGDNDFMVVSRENVNTYKSTVGNIKTNFKNTFGIDSINNRINELGLSSQLLKSDINELSSKTLNLDDLSLIRPLSVNVSNISVDLNTVETEIAQFKIAEDQPTNDFHLIKLGYNEGAEPKTYKVQLDANGKAYVKVPWLDLSGATADEVQHNLERYQLSIEQTIVPKINSISTDVNEISTKVVDQSYYGENIADISTVLWQTVEQVYGYAYLRYVKTFTVDSQKFDTYLGILADTQPDYVLKFEAKPDSVISTSGEWHLYDTLGQQIHGPDNPVILADAGISITLNAPVYTQFYIGDVFRIIWHNETSTWVPGTPSLIDRKQGDFLTLSNAISNSLQYISQLSVNDIPALDLSISEISDAVDNINNTKLNSNALSAEEWTITYKTSTGNILSIVKKIAMYTT